MKTVDDIVIGDKVELNSGGPTMIVYDRDGEVCRCNWLFGGVLVKADFQRALLRKA